MRLTQLTQDDYCVKRKIEDLLKEIKRLYGLKQVEIADRLGVTEGTITRQKDPEIGASTQMLAALVLLTKVLEVERRPMGQIEQMEARITKLENLCFQKYPSRTEGHHVLNEPIPDASFGNPAANIETPKDQADKAGPSVIRKAKGKQ